MITLSYLDYFLVEWDKTEMSSVVSLGADTVTNSKTLN